MDVNNTIETTEAISPDMIVFIVSQLLYLIGELLYHIGLAKLFSKCGKKWWHALVPFLNYYELSKIANREKQGRVFMVTQVLVLLCSSYFSKGLSPDTNNIPATIAYLIIFVLYSALTIVNFIYSIYIYNGLAERFGRRKRWTFLWLSYFDIFSLRGITAMIWGFSSKFQPLPIEQLSAGSAPVEEGDDAPDEALSPEELAPEDYSAEKETEPLELTVNIRERTAKDFIYTKTLLKDIKLTIPGGHMVLLLGGSGAGKTTFLNAVTGYEKADADILIGENNVYEQYESMKYDIGFVPQLDLMRGNDTVYHTIEDAASLRLPKSISDEEKKKRVDEVIQRFGLRSVQTSLVDKLSGGQRKRLSIAMEFISDPSLFILDEPDSGLDGIVARNLFVSLRSIADQGKIVIVITHTPDRVIDLFDDVIVLAKDKDRTGRLAYYGSVSGAYEFFGKEKTEEFLLSVNQKDEGGEGKADYYVSKYAAMSEGKEEAV